MSTRRGSHVNPQSSSDRTPLRNVQNEMLGLQQQTPSFSTKPNVILGCNVLKTKCELVYRPPVPMTDCTPSAQTTNTASKISDVIQGTYASADDHCATGGLGDITFKSFICSGGEVEVLDDASRMSEKTPILIHSPNQSYSFCDESEFFEGNVEDLQSSRDHVDHPYCNLEGDVTLSKDDSSTSTGPIMLNTPDRAADNSVNTSSQLFSVSHMDGIANADAIVVPSLPQEIVASTGHVTFKSFICTEVEVEVSDTSRMSEKSVLTEDLTGESHPPSFCNISENYKENIKVLQSRSQHADHLYCHSESDATSSRDGPSTSSIMLNTSEQASENGVDTSAQLRSVSRIESCANAEASAVLTVLQELDAAAVDQWAADGLGDIAFKPFICTGVEIKVSDDASVMSEDPVPINELTVESHPLSLCNSSENLENSEVLQSSTDHADHPYCKWEISMSRDDLSAVAGLEKLCISDKAVESGPDASDQSLPESHKESLHAGDRSVPSYLPESDSDVFSASTSSSMLITEDGALSASSAHSQNALPETSMAKDSALGSSGDQQHLSEAEVLRSESLADALAEALSLQSQGKLCGASALSAPSTPRMSSISKSPLLDQREENPGSRLWTEVLESPMPPPQLNSTALLHSLSCSPLPAPPPRACGAAAEVALVPPAQSLVPGGDLAMEGNGPPQQQLQQMVEMLMLALGKVAVVPPVAPIVCHSAAVGTSPVGRHNACTWTTPVRWTERSMNTSGLVELVKEMFVSDASTSTDSLLWNRTPGSLESLSRRELEQQLTSALIMVEALCQQQATARGHSQRAGPGPSDLRDRLVQTDHTELSQMEIYKELYVMALERIQSLEMDLENLQSLHHNMQTTRIAMSAIKLDTEEALCSMKEIGDIVDGDQKSISRQVGQMKALYGKCRETLRRMEQKTRDSVQERDDMRQKMEEAIQAKDSAFSVTQQLRVRHVARLAELEQSLGSHQELMEALAQAYPQQVELNKVYVESLNAANELLKGKLDDHASLFEELRKAQYLLQRTKPVLLKLHERAASAVELSEQYLAERDQALQGRAQMQDELDQAHSSLQDAGQQIGDLNMQLTIMNSEMSVLRQQLGEVEEQRAQLQRKSTELSATVTSTLASYAFLEQALAGETRKSQQCSQEAQQATDRASGLEVALEASERQVEELREVLDQREGLVSELHAQAEVQVVQMRQLRQLQVDLSSAREMTEFLQMENELAREQVSESEGLLRSHLQGLRERNLECEDLKLALAQLSLERDSLQEDLDNTRAKARSMLLDQGHQLAQATSDVTVLHHRLRCLTNSLHGALCAKKPEPSGSCNESSQVLFHMQRHPSSSFVDSVMVAITAEGAKVTETVASSDTEVEEGQAEGLGSGNSAFTRVPPTTPKKQEEEQQSSVVELLADLGETVSELTSTTEQLRLRSHTEQEGQQQAISGLQEELHQEAHRHRAEVAELQEQVERLQVQVEKDAEALQHKAQEEKALKKLCSEMDDSVEAAQRHRAENIELRRTLQQSQVEVQALREELTRAGGQSETCAKALDERIRMLKEVEKLQRTLVEAEESRAKVLEKAKRHQRVHAMNQAKLERELRLLDDMIETVRKTLSSVPHVVKPCPELQNLVDFLG